MDGLTEKERIKQTLKLIIQYRCRIQEKTPLEVIREMRYELNQLKHRNQ